MPLPGVDGDAQKGQKVDGDFIVLSEFSEQVGPIPIVSETVYRRSAVWVVHVLHCTCIEPIVCEQANLQYSPEGTVVCGAYVLCTTKAAQIGVMVVGIRSTG